MNLRIRHKGLYPQYEREKLSISDWGRWLAKEGETGTHTVNLYQAVLCGWHPTLFSGFWEKITLAQAGYNRRNSSLLPLPDKLCGAFGTQVLWAAALIASAF